MIYLARLPCGCVISSCDDETGLLWFYLVIGNGWTIEILEAGQAFESECADCQAAQPLKTQWMF